MLFETTQGVLLSDSVKVVKSIHADRDLSSKCHRQVGNKKRGETMACFYLLSSCIKNVEDLV